MHCMCNVVVVIVVVEINFNSIYKEDTQLWGTVPQSSHLSDPPTVHVEKSTIYTGPGHKVSVECIFDANPPVSVIWTHNGTDVDFDQRQNIHMAQLSADNDGIREILEINNLQPTDLGTYRCDGGNDRGTAYEDVTLSGTCARIRAFCRIKLLTVTCFGGHMDVNC